MDSSSYPKEHCGNLFQSYCERIGKLTKDFEAWAYERLKSVAKLSNGQSCVGEEVCVSDPVLGPVKRKLGATLESHCKPKGCPLYFTKEGSTPLEFEAAFASSVRIRERRIAGILRRADYDTAFAEETYLAAERVRRKVQAEMQEEATSDTKKTKPMDVEAAKLNDPHKRFAFLHDSPSQG